MPKPWTKEQIEYFEKSFGNVSLKTIAKNLGKDVRTVDAWRYRNGYPTSTQAHEGIPVYEFSAAVKMNDQTIYRYWIREKGLPIISFKPLGKAAKMMVNLKEFWQWAFGHRDFIDFSKFEPGALGEEPDWVCMMRKLDYYDKGKKGWERPWTPEEDSRMIEYLKTFRYTYRQLTERLNRTELSIQNRLYQIGCKYRPLAEARRDWSKSEEEMLILMRLAGDTVGVIAKALNRNQLQVKNKWERLKRSGKVQMAG